MPRDLDLNIRFTADAEPLIKEIRRVRAELAMPWPLRILLLLVLLIDILSPFGSTVFLPKPVDGVIDLLWIALNAAAAWCIGPRLRAWLERNC